MSLGKPFPKRAEDIERPMDSARPDEQKQDDFKLLKSQGAFHYFGAIRAQAGCVECHQRLADEGTDRPLRAKLKEGDLLAGVSKFLDTGVVHGFGGPGGLAGITPIVAEHKSLDAVPAAAQVFHSP